MMTNDGENGGTDKTSSPRVNWNDPDVPAGDSPPLPAWPLPVAAALWCACVVFLVVTAIRG